MTGKKGALCILVDLSTLSECMREKMHAPYQYKKIVITRFNFS